MSPMRDLVAVILTAAIFGLTYGLSAPLIALQFDAAGWGAVAIGLNAAMHALGVLLIAPVLPAITARLGVMWTAWVALGGAAVTLLLFPAVPVLWLWFPLRLVLGISSETLFVVSETWVNRITSEYTRARSMAAYTASLSLGFAVGPLFISLIGSTGSTAFGAAAGVAVLAAALLLVMRPRPVPIEPAARISPWLALRIAPIVVATTALNAALETAGLNLLPLYAVNLGWSETQATLLITILLIGAIVLQLPIGWIADRIDRRRFATWLAAVSALGAAAWPLALASPWLAFPLLFIWGGTFVGIYTLIITLLGSRFGGGELIGLYTILSVAWGVGALIGPTLGGVAMQISTHGLPLFAAMGCTALALFMASSRAPI